MKVIVIGGGAAGMMCSVISARQGADVTLIEKNEKTGKKLYITGKGRCNLTNCTDFDGYLNSITTNPKFMYSALKDFDGASTMSFFENAGLKLKVERGNRVFPESDKSGDVIKCLNKELANSGVKVKLNEKVTGLTIKDNRITEVITDKGTYTVDKAVICTGGISYPATGSTGDGYKFASEAGHSIVMPIPSLCGFNVKKVLNANGKEVSLKDLPSVQGVSLKNVSVGIFDKQSGETLQEEFGEMLFTENGVSGPIILTLSSKFKSRTFQDKYLSIDLKPALSEEKLDERILRDFAQNKNKSIKNVLHGLLPSSLIPFVLTLTEIEPDKPVNIFSKIERKRLVNSLKNITLTELTREDFSKAIITSGGVNVKEVNPTNMRSKLIDNLYFAGEVLDVDALTGGFNLQIAFSTAYAVGKHILE